MQQRSIPSGAERMIQHIVRDGRFSAGTPCTTLHGGNEVKIKRGCELERYRAWWKCRVYLQ